MLRVAQGSGQVRSGDELASCQFLKFSVNIPLVVIEASERVVIIISSGV
jgi:hypothetical protein